MNVDKIAKITLKILDATKCNLVGDGKNLVLTVSLTNKQNFPEKMWSPLF